MAVAALSQLKLVDFSGGLNLRDAPSELAPNESPDMLNVTLDERGGVVKRLGYAKDGSMSAFSADIANLFYSHVLGQMIVQAGAVVKRRTGAGTFSDLRTFTTSARVTFAEFKNLLLMLHPVDGLYKVDSAFTVTLIDATVDGVAIAVWQNRVWVAVGTADTTNRTRLRFSAIGDEATWTGSNDLREVDDAPLTALHVSSRSGLNAFKATSAYRVHDSTTGAYTTIDADTGCPGALAVTSLDGLLTVVNERGIFVSDGLSPLAEVSHKVSPLFTAQQLVLSAQDKFCAGVSPAGHFLFSLRRTGASVNDLTLEYNPRLGWFVAHSFGAAAFAVLAGTDDTLYHGDPGSARFLYKTFSGGSDNGTAIASHFQTRWFEPAAGLLTRLQHVRPSGIGAFSLYLRRDYEQAGGELLPFSIAASSGGTWGTFVWGTDAWGTSMYEGYDDFWPRLPAKALSFRLEESSSLTRTGASMLGGGAAPELGAFALYGLLTDYVSLEAI